MEAFVSFLKASQVSFCGGYFYSDARLTPPYHYLNRCSIHPVANRYLWMPADNYYQTPLLDALSGVQRLVIGRQLGATSSEIS